MKAIPKILINIVSAVILIALYILCYGSENKIRILLCIGWSVSVTAILTWFPQNVEFKSDKIWKMLTIISIVVCTILAGLLCLRPTVWYDEAYTIGMINRSYGDIIEITSNDVHSPLYYFSLKLMSDFFKEGYTRLHVGKIFSALFFLGHLIIGSRLCRKIYNEKAAFFWTLLAGFMPAMIILSTSVRMYMFGMFFFTITAYCAYNLFQKESLLRWIVFTLFSIITMYVHTFSMIETFILYLILFGSFLWKKRYKSLKAFFISGAIAAIAYVPWLLTLWHQMRRWAGMEAGWGSHMEELTYENSNIFLSEWFSSLEIPNGLAILFTIGLFIYVSYYVRKYVNETKDYKPYAGIAIVGLTAIIGIIVSLGVVPCFIGRYVFPVFGLVWLFIAIGLEQIKDVRKLAVIAVCIVTCGLASFYVEWQLDNDDGLKEYRTFMENNVEEGDVVMVGIYTDAMMTLYGPEANYMIYGSKPNGLPFDNLEVFTEWEQLNGVDTIWVVEIFEGRANLSEYYTSEVVLRFHFSYYDYTVRKLTRID